MITLKNEKEIKKIKEACHIVYLAHEAIKKAIRPGVTTRELDKIGEEVIKANGANPSCKGYPQGSDNPFPATCCISVNDEIIHGIPSGRKLKDGDLVSVDIVADKDGYFGDAARSYVVGKNQDAERLIKATEECFWEGIKQAVIGNRISDISHAIQVHAEKNGYSVIKEYQGHGVGFEMHEDPGVPNYGKPGKGPRLQEGMVIAVEPMVNEGSADVFDDADDGWTVVTADGKLAAHYENTIVITKDGPKVLTID